MERREALFHQLCSSVPCLCNISRRPAHSLHPAHSAAVGGVAGLWNLQRLLAYEAAGMVVRWAVGVCDLSWRLSLALFGIRLAARLPVRAGKSGRLLNPYLAGLLNFSIYQSQAPAVGKNLSSLCRTKSVLLRARLFPRWRRASRISSRRRSIGEGFHPNRNSSDEPRHHTSHGPRGSPRRVLES